MMAITAMAIGTINCQENRPRPYITVDNDNIYFTLPVPKSKAYINNKGPFINAVPTTANYSTTTSQSHSDVLYSA
jgi:hypothetical protein